MKLKILILGMILLASVVFSYTYSEVVYTNSTDGGLWLAKIKSDGTLYPRNTFTEFLPGPPMGPVDSHSFVYWSVDGSKIFYISMNSVHTRHENKA